MRLHSIFNRRRDETMDKLTYNTTQAAAALGVSRPTLHRLLRAGLPHIRVGARILIPADSLRGWIVKRAEEGTHYD